MIPRPVQELRSMPRARFRRCRTGESEGHGLVLNPSQPTLRRRGARARACSSTSNNKQCYGSASNLLPSASQPKHDVDRAVRRVYTDRMARR